MSGLAAVRVYVSLFLSESETEGIRSVFLFYNANLPCNQEDVIQPVV
jgi:hypothetical protein